MGLRQESQPRRRRAPVPVVGAATPTVVGVLATALPAVAGGLHAEPCQQPASAEKPIEDEQYDPATKCRDDASQGMKALQNWLEHNVRGETWGIYRCEKLKDGNYSLHSESRAIDWHLDAGVAKENRAAHRFIDTLLARDREGQPARARTKDGDPGTDL